MKDRIHIVKELSGLVLSNFTEVHYEDLPEVYDGSCEYVHSSHTFEFSSDNILEEIIGKVKRKGTISLVGNDLLEISRDISNGLHSMVVKNQLEEMRKKIFGGRLRLFTIKEIVDLLTSKGFSISKKRLKDGQFFIEAVRQ